MTSCDNNLAQWILPQIASIGVNLYEYDVHFYLFHYRITPENTALIQNYCNTFENITFHEVIMQNSPLFEELAKHGGRFPPEAYAYMHCHEQLPEDEERVLYIDAGDVIIHGDISEYYFDDFEGNSVIMTPMEFAVLYPDGTHHVFDENDLANPEYVHKIRGNHVNSGVLVLNLKKFRANANGLADHYLSCVEKLRNMNLRYVQNIEGAMYLGDQGIFAIAFVGDMKMFGYDEVVKHTAHYSINSAELKTDAYTYNAYNFLQAYHGGIQASWYAPVVIHYATPLPKPWWHEYTLAELENPEKLPELAGSRKKHVSNHMQLETHKVWRKYNEISKFPHLPPSKRRNHLIPINQNWYLAENYLHAGEFNKAKKHIDLVANCIDENSATIAHLILSSLLIRFHVNSSTDPKRFRVALEIADAYIKRTTKPEYESINIFYLKGLCHNNLGEFAEAIEAYSQCYYIIDAYLMGALETSGDLVFVGYSVPCDNNGKWACINAIVGCCRKIGNYDLAFLWMSRVLFSKSDHVKLYFLLINESGQAARVQELFNLVAKSKSEECFATFDEILLPNPNAVEFLASFFETYVRYAKSPIANHLRYSDELMKKGDTKAALESFKKALDADNRFAPLLKSRLDKFQV